jgi:hypothetical protein
MVNHAQCDIRRRSFSSVAALVKVMAPGPRGSQLNDKLTRGQLERWPCIRCGDEYSDKQQAATGSAQHSAVLYLCGCRDVLRAHQPIATDGN